MTTREFQNDINPANGGPLLAPHRPNRRLGHVNAIDWSACQLAQRFNISGETRGGPRRKLPRVA